MNSLEIFLKSSRFIVIGGHKCGTSSLHSYLAQHPNIIMPKQKGEDLLNKVNLKLKNYANSYDISDSSVIYGEVSSVYLYSARACTRIKQNFPNSKLIIILRNPVDRAFSHYNADLKKNNQFSNVRFEEIARKPSYYKEIRYLKNGMYSQFVEQYLKFFGKEHIHILLFDDLVNSKKIFFQTIFQFIGVDDNFLPDTSYIIRKGGTLQKNLLSEILLKSSFFKNIIKTFLNPLTTSRQRYILRYKVRNLLTSKNQVLKEDLKVNLLKFYKQEILKLESLIDRDLSSCWLKPLSNSKDISLDV